MIEMNNYNKWYDVVFDEWYMNVKIFFLESNNFEIKSNK